MARRPLALALSTVLVLPLAAGTASAAEVDRLPAELTGRTTQITGEVHRIAVDMIDAPSYIMTVVADEDGEAVRVDEEAVADVPSGSQVTLDLVTETIDDDTVGVVDAGAEVEDVEILEEARSDLAETPFLNAPADGKTRYVDIVAGRFSGQSSDGVAGSVIKTDVTSMVAPFWSRTTGGKVKLSVRSTKTASTTAPSFSSCTDNAIYNVLNFASSQAGVRAGGGTGRHVIFYAPLRTECGFAGIAHLADGGAIWINGSRDGAAYRRSTIAHEVGHNLTLGHANSLHCSSKADSGSCTEGEYGNAYDIMGTSNGAGPISGAHMHRLGLLSSGNSTDVTRAQGTSRLTLRPVGNNSGKRFATFVTGGVRYFVEYRGKYGDDSDLGNGGRFGCPHGVTRCSSGAEYYQPGVIIHRGVNDTHRSTHLLNAAGPNVKPWFILPAGKTFTTKDGKFTVRTVSTGSTATVDITQSLAPTKITGLTGTVLKPGQRFTKNSKTTVTWTAPSTPNIEGFQVLVNGHVKIRVAGNARKATVNLAVGTNKVSVRTLSTPRQETAAVTVIRDDKAPKFTTAPRLELRNGTVSTTAAPVVLRYRVEDNRGVDSLRQTGPTGRTATLKTATTQRATSIGVGYKRWSLVAADAAGHKTEGATYRGIAFAPETMAKRTGSWSTLKSSTYLNGKAMSSRTPKATMTLTSSNAQSIAWVATKSPASGKATIYVDGKWIKEVDLYSKTTKQRQTVYIANGLGGGQHTIKIVVQGTKGRPMVTSDGFVILK